MRSIYDMTLQQLEDYFIRIGEKKFKAVQVFEWLYKKRVKSFEEMNNVKKETLEQLKQTFQFRAIELVTVQEGSDVKKFLFRMQDHELIEAVVMYHDYGTSLCVSTQVGCNMCCTFCESGRRKKVRNLEVYEMVEQVLFIEEWIGTRLTHVVLMGIGEPFDNYDHVMAFLSILNEGKGIDLGARHITVSTCGIVPKIKEFMKTGKQVNLAISLHAPTDELRRKIMPINKVYPLTELMEVLTEYSKVTGRRITFEYILLDHVNDRIEHALLLAQLLKGMNAYVNLIPYNETSHIKYKKSQKETIQTFYDTLKKNKINVTIRREFGSELKAACGQLRSTYEEED